MTVVLAATIEEEEAIVMDAAAVIALEMKGTIVEMNSSRKLCSSIVLQKSLKVGADLVLVRW